MFGRSHIIASEKTYLVRVKPRENELAEKISEFADVEVELAKKDITSREQV